MLVILLGFTELLDTQGLCHSDVYLTYPLHFYNNVCSTSHRLSSFTHSKGKPKWPNLPQQPAT